MDYYAGVFIKFPLENFYPPALLGLNYCRVIVREKNILCKMPVFSECRGDMNYGLNYIDYENY